MRVTVHYEDGSVEEFDTSTLTTESALGRPNALTDIHITIGDGVWANVSWYRVPTGRASDLADRMPGCRIHLLNEDEISRIRSIELDGRLQWLRVGDDLCDVARLDEVSDLMSWPHNRDVILRRSVHKNHGEESLSHEVNKAWRFLKLHAPNGSFMHRALWPAARRFAVWCKRRAKFGANLVQTRRGLGASKDKGQRT